MTTKNPRINVTFDETMAGVLYELAKNEDRSVSSLVRDLTVEALELREDLYLSRLAEQVDSKKSKKIDHDKAWE